MFKNKILLFSLFLLVASCADTFSNVKRGLTGEKRYESDEFLIKKKDPLILPPDFESLPTPDDRDAATQETTNFEKSLGSSIEENSSGSSSAEQSILKKIQSK